MKFVSVIALIVLAGAPAFAACPAGTVEKAGSKVEGKQVCTIAGSYLSADLSLTPENAYVLEGDVRIGGDNTAKSTLTIAPGTTVYGSQGSYLVISRGSQIFANGTASQPVVFTALERVNPLPGYWGGLVLTGNAPINSCKGSASNCDNFVEGIQTNPPKFGGDKADDNSGVLRYVRSEYAGYTLSADNELNSITFYAVGRQTIVEHIEAYKGADDGLEIFGGTVNVKYFVSIDNDDDGLDWDMGWTGNLQFALIQLENATEADPNGIEADNLKSPMDAMPRSNPVISNVTIIGKGNNPKLLNGMMLRRGTGGQIYNTIITGQFQSCINLDDEETFKNAGAFVDGKFVQSGLVIQNSIAQCNGAIFNEDKAKDLYAVSAWFGAEDRNNFVLDPQIKDWSPLGSSPTLDTGYTAPEVVVGQWVNGTWTQASFFVPVDFVGALSGNVNEDWTTGWVVK